MPAYVWAYLNHEWNTRCENIENIQQIYNTMTARARKKRIMNTISALITVIRQGLNHNRIEK